MLYYEDVRDALGGSLVDNAYTEDYGGWTPNNYKTIALFDDGVYVEFHTGDRHKLYRAKTKNPSKKAPLSVFRNKQFGALETLIVPSYLLEGTFTLESLSKCFSDETRLAEIVVYDVPVSVEVFAKSYRSEVDAKTPEGKSVRGRALPAFTSSTVASFVSETAAEVVQVQDLDSMYKKFVLVPQVYSADLQEGKLFNYLGAIREQYTPKVSEEPAVVSADPSGQDDLAERIEDFNSSRYKSDILKVLRACLESGDPSLVSSIVRYAHPGLGERASSLPWVPAIVSRPSFGSSFDESLPGVLLDCNDSHVSALRFIKGWPVEKIRSFFPEGVNQSNVTLSDILASLESPADAADDAADDESDDFDEPSVPTDTLPPLPEVQVVEGEIHPSPDLEEAVRYHRQGIMGTVRSILAEYNKIFASGFGPLQPVGVLTSNDKGRARILSIRGNNNPTRVLNELWSCIQPNLDANPQPETSAEGIARNVLTSDNPETVYFPNKMMQYAFGLDSTGKSSPHGSSWESYRDQEIKPSLEGILSAVVRMAYKSNPDMLEDVENPDNSKIIDPLLTNLQRAFTTCVLISEYIHTEDRTVKLKVRILSQDGDFSKQGNIVRKAIQEAERDDGGIGASNVAPISDGMFWEFTHITDKVLATAEPLFAYKLLQSLQRQGKSIDPKDYILGINERDEVTTSSSGGFELDKHTTHMYIAGSRAGKGVMTQAALAGKLSCGIPVGLADNKPDMASVLRMINPDAFVINGPNVNNNPSGGDDMHSMFTEDYIAHIESIAKVPDYLSDLGDWSYRANLGTLGYVRYMTLAMGMLGARTIKGASPHLGGEQGITLVFDEVNTLWVALKGFLDANKQKIAPTRIGVYYAQQKAKEEKAIASAAKKGEEPLPVAPMEPPVSPAHMWMTAFYESLRYTLNSLSTLKNAGFMNTEARINDIYIIGQEPLTPISTAEDINRVLPPRWPKSTGVKGEFSGDLLVSLCSLGGVDAFLGYNKDIPSILDQVNTNADRLNASARQFGYISAFRGDRAARAVSGDVKFASEEPKFVKPALLFADTGITPIGYCWTNMTHVLEEAGVDPEVVMNNNLDENGNPSKGVSFLGYLEMAGCSKEQAAATLQVLSDAANWTVSRMGYPGSWLEFVYDFRPEWIFSVKDVLDVVKTGSRKIDHLSEFRELYPEIAGSTPLTGNSSNEVEWDQNLVSPTSNLTVDDFDETPVPLGDQVTGLVSVDAIDPAFDEFDDSFDGGDTGTPKYATPIPVESPELLAPIVPGSEHLVESKIPAREPVPVSIPLEISPEVIANMLEKDLESFLGSWSNLRRLSIEGNALIVNGVLFRTRIDTSSAQGVYIPDYLVSAIKTSTVAGIINWSILKRAKNLAVFSVDSAESFYSYVVPDLGYDSRFTPGKIFSDFPHLVQFGLGSEIWDRETYKAQNGVPSGYYTVDAMQRAMIAGSSFLSRGRSNAWRYTTNAWRRDDLGGWGKTWRTFAGIGAVATMGVTQAANSGLRGLLGSAAQAVHSLRQDMKEFS